MSGLRFALRYGRFNAILLGLLGMGRRHSSFVVSGDEVAVRMGWAFQTRIPRSSIVTAQTDDRSVLGWGVHGWRSRWLVNGSSKGLLRVTIDPPAPARVCGFPVELALLRVSLDDRDAALEALG